MQDPEASGPRALADLPSTLSTAIGSPTTSPLDLVPVASTLSTAVHIQSPTGLSHQQIQHNIQHVLSTISSDYENGRAFAAGGNSSGSTGKGILIGILSAFGSAAIAFLVLAIFFFFKYTRRGRIMLDRIGRPGEFDDEQAFAREEEAALESMDDLSRSEYLRAKGMALNGFHLYFPYSYKCPGYHVANNPFVQPSFKSIRPNLCKPTFLFPNFSQYRKRVSLRGNFSPN